MVWVGRFMIVALSFALFGIGVSFVVSSLVCL